MNPVRARARHLLSRLTYGLRPGELDALASGGEPALKAWLEAQLTPESIPDPELDSRLARLKTLKLTSTEIAGHYRHLGELLKLDGITGMSVEDPAVRVRYHDRVLDRVLEDLQYQRFVRALHAKAQLAELLFEFWFNHFNVDWGKIPVRWLLTSYERDAIRPHLFGKFRDLVQATAHHPAMLEFLDNTVSRFEADGRGVNENYARELMELHTLGSGGGYTQEDVIALARILTGWTQERPLVQAEFAFHPASHDPGSKVFLGQVFQAEGVHEGERAIDGLARHKSTAKLIARKLARFFVSDTPPESLVVRLASKFEETDGDLRELYRTLFQSDEFWSAGAVGAKTKRPFQFLVSALRALDGAASMKVEDIASVNTVLAMQGEPMYLCDSPTGYADDPRYWITPGAMLLRMRASIAIARNGFPGASISGPVAGQEGEGSARLLEEEAGSVLNGEPSAELRKVVDDRLARSAPGDKGALKTWVHALALASPEFQRR